MDTLLRVQPSSEAQEVVIRFFRALGNHAQLMDVFAEDATWTVWGNLPFSGTHRGRTAVVEGFHEPAAALFDKDFPGSLEITCLIGEGPEVAAEFHYRTRTALGREYHNHYVEVFEIRDGKIQHVREYMDTQHLCGACY
jgi:uncharacterized protein